MDKNICPVCGYDKLFEPPYDENGVGSLEICKQCGFQFGYDDYPYEKKERLMKAWRERWKACGSPMFTLTGKYWKEPAK